VCVCVCACVRVCMCACMWVCIFGRPVGDNKQISEANCRVRVGQHHCGQTFSTQPWQKRTSRERRFFLVGNVFWNRKSRSCRLPVLLHSTAHQGCSRGPRNGTLRDEARRLFVTNKHLYHFWHEKHPSPTLYPGLFVLVAASFDNKVNTQAGRPSIARNAPPWPSAYSSLGHPSLFLDFTFDILILFLEKKGSQVKKSCWEIKIDVCINKGSIFMGLSAFLEEKLARPNPAVCKDGVRKTGW